MTSSFSNLSLAEPLARAVAEMGYESMTPIQAEAIPVVMTGKDVMGAAQTGTGKTAAFSLPLLHRLLKHENTSTSPARHPVRALVLLPTRELADQVAQQVKLYAKYTNIRSAVVFGGMDMKPQTLELKKGVEVLVATPGRLLDHIEAKNAVLNQVEYVVLDEADRMLDIGFLPDLQRILSFLPKQRTTLLFSATFSPEIKRLASSYLQDPVTIEVARPNATASTVEQHFYSVGDDDKRHAIHQVLKTRGIKQAFIFVNSKLGCARLARSLEKEGLKTTALHGDKSQDERLKALERLQGRRGGSAGGHRRGGARAGHQGRAGGLQLRCAVQCRRLHSPHRPHRSCGRFRAGGDPGFGQRWPLDGRPGKAAGQENRGRGPGVRRRQAARAHQHRPARLGRGRPARRAGRAP